MAKPMNHKRKTAPKRVLRLPDLDLAKRTVLSSLGSPDSSRAYAHAIDDFIAWYCSEPRLAFGKHVVLRYRIELESRLLAPATINVRLAAVRRLAYEAADSGLLSPELAAGIQSVKGAKKLGVRLGNWLTVDECRRLLRAPDEHALKGRLGGRRYAAIEGANVLADIAAENSRANRLARPRVLGTPHSAARCTSIPASSPRSKSGC